MNCEIFCSSSVKNAIGNFYGSHWSYRLHFVFSQYWFFLLRNMESLSICLCHLWFLSLVSYNFLCTVLLSPSVQFSSVSQSCLTLCNPMDCSTPGLPVHHQLPDSPKPMSIKLVIPSNHLILCRLLLLLPSIFPSIRVFSNESDLHIRWPKYWSFNFSISPPVSTQDWSPLGWAGCISLQSMGLSRVFSNTTVQKHQFSDSQLSL